MLQFNPALVTSRNAIIVLKPGSRAMNRRLYCPPPAWRLIATALKCEFLKEYGKLPCKVGSNSYIQDYLLMVDRRCYENRGHKMHLPLRLPEKKKKKEPSPTQTSNKSLPPHSLPQRVQEHLTHVLACPEGCLRGCCQHDTSYLPPQRVPRYSDRPKDRARSEERNGKGSGAKPTGL